MAELKIGTKIFNVSVNCVRQTMDELDVKGEAIGVLNESQGTAEEPAGASEMGSHDFVPAEAKVTLRSLRAETEMQAISQALRQTGLESQTCSPAFEH